MILFESIFEMNLLLWSKWFLKNLIVSVLRKRPIRLHDWPCLHRWTTSNTVLSKKSICRILKYPKLVISFIPSLLLRLNEKLRIPIWQIINAYKVFKPLSITVQLTTSMIGGLRRHTANSIMELFWGCFVFIYGATKTKGLKIHKPLRDRLCFC